MIPCLRQATAASQVRARMTGERSRGGGTDPSLQPPNGPAARRRPPQVGGTGRESCAERAIANLDAAVDMDADDFVP